MKYVSPLRVAALVCNIMLRTLPRKITDNASNMTYSHFFLVWYSFKNFLYHSYIILAIIL